MPDYITITGQKHYYGILPFVIGACFSLEPETKNLFDPEAISVISPIYGKVGSVAQSESMLAEGTISSSEIFPFLSANTNCIVRFIAGEYIIAEIYEKEDA